MRIHSNTPNIPNLPESIRRQLNPNRHGPGTTGETRTQPWNAPCLPGWFTDADSFCFFMLALVTFVPLGLVITFMSSHSMIWHAPLPLSIAVVALPLAFAAVSVWLWWCAHQPVHRRGPLRRHAANVWYEITAGPDAPLQPGPWRSYAFGLFWAYCIVVALITVAAFAMTTDNATPHMAATKSSATPPRPAGTQQAAGQARPVTSAPRLNAAQLLGVASKLAPVQERYRRRHGHYAPSLAALRSFARTVAATPGLTVTSFTGANARESSWALAQNGQQLVHFSLQPVGAFLRQTAPATIDAPGP